MGVISTPAPPSAFSPQEPIFFSSGTGGNGTGDGKANGNGEAPGISGG